MSSNKKHCVVVLLTFNSEGIIRETLEQAKKISNDIFVVDSGSSDKTAEIARHMGCNVVDRAFTNYSDQRNWAIKQVELDYEWQLHLDADEVLDDVAVNSILSTLKGANNYDAYLIKRRDYFMGTMLKFSGVNPWHLRLFKSGAGQCENRLYDQHFVANTPTGQLNGFMHDKNASSLSDWTARHNRWSDLEAVEMGEKNKHFATDVLQARFFGDARERTRYIKSLYYKLPIGMRSLSYFFYRYFFRLGILDGVPGFYFAFFQAFWFRMLVDAKMYENNRK